MRWTRKKSTMKEKDKQGVSEGKATKNNSAHTKCIKSVPAALALLPGTDRRASDWPIGTYR